MASRALVSVVLGDGYRRFYDRHIRPGHERFARQLACPLHVFTRPLVSDSDVDHPHASWEKVKILEEPELAGYEQLGWLDADLFVLGEPPDPFTLAGDGWLGVDDDTYGDREQSELGRRWWYGFLPEAAWPEQVINTGMFVVRRRHRPLLRAIYDHYGGRWDQGPLSYHLLREPEHTLGPADLNRLVIHHLGSRGYGPSSMAELVGRDGLLHFAAASALRTPDYLAWATRADEGREAGRRLSARAHLRAIRYAFERPARSGVEGWLRRHSGATSKLLAPLLQGRVPRLDGALASVPEWQAQVLDRALAAQPNLLLTRSQEAYPGWVTVDPVTPMISGTSNRKFGATAAAVLVKLDAVRAVESRPAQSVARLLVMGVLEALPVDQRSRFLRACRRACRGDVCLLVAGAPPRADAPAPFRVAMDQRHALDREELLACLEEAKVEAEVVTTGHGLAATGLRSTPIRLPHGHHWVRLEGSPSGPVGRAGASRSRKR